MPTIQADPSNHNSEIAQARAEAVLRDDDSVVIQLATELGLVPPVQLEALRNKSWLGDTVAAWISEAQEALADANDVACAMTDASSAAQLFTQNLNSLARLQLRNQQALEEQPSLQQEIENLRSRQFQLSLAVSELEEWSSTADERLYENFMQCFQKRQRFTEELILLPLQLSTIVQQMGAYAPWDCYRKRGLVEVGRVLVKHREWGTVSRIIEGIFWLLMEVPPQLASIQISDDAIAKATDTLEIDGLGTVSALEKLLHLTHCTVEEVNRLPVLWNWHAEAISDCSYLDCAAAKLQAIKMQALAIFQNAKPSAIEPTLRRITRETVSGMFISAHTGLNQLHAETEQEIQRLEKQLNQQVRLAANLQTQITAAQEQVEAFRCEADVKFRRAILMLEELVQLPQMPKELQFLIEQYRQFPSNILSQAARFSAHVHFCQNRTEKLKKVISSRQAISMVILNDS